MFKAFFEICEDNNCPLYDLSERFELSDKVLTVPENKQVCLILVREMTQLLFTLLGSADNQEDAKTYSCSGCTGLIKFKQIISEEEIEDSKQRKKEQIDAFMIKQFGMTTETELFQVIPAAQLKKLFEKCTRHKFRRGHVIIEKGQINKNVFFILSGSVVIEDGPVQISHLADGELVGEMSYLGSSVATTTAKCSRDTVVLSISGDEFSKLLKRSSGLQLFMAQLLAKRLSSANRARAEAFDSCMTGNLNEMAPAELLQVFNMHSKTGVLTLEMSRGHGSVSFREGAIISAYYNDFDGSDAVYAILGEREGAYKFSAGLTPQELKYEELGDFMAMLMEGVKRLDETQ